jgi:hypothetical protein
MDPRNPARSVRRHSDGARRPRHARATGPPARGRKPAGLDRRSRHRRGRARGRLGGAGGGGPAAFGRADRRTRKAGGQYFKPVAGGHDGPAPDAQHRAGDALRDRLGATDTRHLTGTTVWHARSEGGVFELGLFDGDARGLLHVRALMLATGAYERPPMLPGWTLPGVMTVGAAQTLIRSHRTAPGRRIVIAGHGPLGLQLGAELCRMGTPPVAVLERATPTRAAALPHVLAAARADAGLVAKGLGYRARLARAGVPVLEGWEALAFHAGERPRRPPDRRPHRDRRAPGLHGGCGLHRRRFPAAGGTRPGARLRHHARSRHGVPGPRPRRQRGDGPARQSGSRGTAGEWAGRRWHWRRARSPGPPPARTWAPPLPILARPARRWPARGPSRRPCGGSTPRPRAQRRPTMPPCSAAANPSPSAQARAAIAQGAGDLGALKRLTRLGMGRCQGRYCAGPAALLTGNAVALRAADARPPGPRRGHRAGEARMGRAPAGAEPDPARAGPGAGGHGTRHGGSRHHRRGHHGHRRRAARRRNWVSTRW